LKGNTKSKLPNFLFLLLSQFPFVNQSIQITLKTMAKPPTIAIIGAGPSGLTLARLLSLQNIPYTIYERDISPSSNLAGGSLDIHAETGQQALIQAGLFTEFKKYARYEDTCVRLTDKVGKKVLEMGQGRDAPEIDRIELRKILLESIPGERVKWGYVLKEASVGKDGRQVLWFGNGEVADGFKLIVGADGAWSKVRSLVCVSKICVGRC
jgi:2-polyprenyl-6-methoxyphenol hydroxylase-like FAD-dependent oxidoreductase